MTLKIFACLGKCCNTQWSFPRHWNSSAVFGLVLGEMDSFLSLCDRWGLNFKGKTEHLFVCSLTQTQPTKSQVKGRSHMCSVYFCLQMHLLDVINLVALWCYF